MKTFWKMAILALVGSVGMIYLAVPGHLVASFSIYGLGVFLGVMSTFRFEGGVQ